MSKRGLVPMAAAALWLLGGSVAGADEHKVTICHATGSDSNPYVLQSPAASGVVHGHMGHQGGQDIVPPFEYKGQTYSQNWDATGQAIFGNGCQVPAGTSGSVEGTGGPLVGGVSANAPGAPSAPGAPGGPAAPAGAVAGAPTFTG